MSRHRIDGWRCVAGALLVAAPMAFVTGCAGTGAVAGGPKEASKEVAPASSARALPAEKDRARVQVERDAGFTVTEVVHIGSDVRTEYQQAIVLLQQNRLVEGIAALERVVERAPDLTAPLIDLGVAYGRSGQWEKAQKSLEAAVVLAPDHPAALDELGIAYRRTGRFEDARASYEHALRVHPTYDFALRNLGVLCDLYLEDLPCAVENYQRYAELVPEDEKVGVWIADLKARMGVASKE